jgi:hypothetical protein
MRKYGNILITIFIKMQIKKKKITVELLTGFLKKVPATFTDTYSRGDCFFALSPVISVNIGNSTSSLFIEGI